MKQLYKICNLYGCVPIKLHQKKKKRKENQMAGQIGLWAMVD